MPDLRELEDLTPEEARALIKRRKAMQLPRRGGRLKTDHVKVKDLDVEGLLKFPRLYIWEILWLYRRRAGKYQREVAAEMGISRLWINKMEMGDANPARLIEYWEAKRQ